MNIPKRIYLKIIGDSILEKWYCDRSKDSDLEYVLLIKGQIPESEHILSRILRVICDENEVKEKDVKGKCRKRELIIARREYCYLARKLTKKSLQRIGNKIKKDHALVLYHENIIEGWLQMGKYNLKEKLEGIEKRLKI